MQSFQFDFTNDEPTDYDGDGITDTVDSVTISHTGGDTVTSDRLKVATGGTVVDVVDSVSNYDDSDTSTSEEFTEVLGADTDVNAGTSLTAATDVDSNSELNSETIRVVWTSEDGSSTQILAEFEVPS